MKASYKKLWKLLVDKEMSKGSSQEEWLVIQHNDETQEGRGCLNGGIA